jgi:hypothetical protein
MMRLARLPAAAGLTERITLGRDQSTLIVLNGLTAPIYAAYGRPASATDWDFAIPGQAYMTIPLTGGENVLHVLVDYPGAVPAADVQAVIWASECRWPPFIGPVA